MAVHAHMPETRVAYNRPAGVWILMGIFLFWGLMNLVVFGALAGFGGAFGASPTLREEFRAIPDATLIAGVTTVAAFFLVLGILSIVCSIGLWNARGWSWGLGVALGVIGLVIFPLGTVLSIVTLTYLVTTRPYFRVMGEAEEAAEGRRPA